MLTSLAELLTAVAALGALAAAVWAGRVSKRLYDIEAARDFRTSERSAKEQAGAVAAWCVVVTVAGTPDEQGLLLHNSSNAPVFDVEVRSTYAVKQDREPTAQPPLSLVILPPGDYVATADEKYNWSFVEERASVRGSVRPVTKNAKWIVTRVAFTDSLGIGWVRHGGLLEKSGSEGM